MSEARVRTTLEHHIKFPHHRLRLRNLLIVALLTLTTIAAYWNLWRNGFVDYDDNQYVTENKLVQRGLSMRNIAWAFTTLDQSNWHPLAWISHMTDCQVFGLWAGGHHLMSLALHMASTLLLFALLLRMTSQPWRSALVAALFALHPLHVESVAWVSERKDVLSTLFGLAAIWFYVDFIRTNRWRWYGLTILFFVLSLLAKPMLVTLPFILLLLDIWPLNRLSLNPKSKIQNPKLLLEKLPLFFISIASSIITIIAQRLGGAMYPLEALPFYQRAWNAIVSYIAYLTKMIWPENLAVLYPHPGVWPLWLVIGAAVILLVITAVAIALRNSRPQLLVGWLWYLGTLVPVIGLLQVGLQAMADRYTYVPLIGIFIMIAWSVPDVSSRPALRFAIPSIAVAILAALAIRTQLQVQHWRDSFELFDRTVAITQRNFIMHNNLGYAYARKNNFDDAIRNYELALSFNSRYGIAHDNLGNALAMKGNLLEAVKHYLVAVELNPKAPRPHNNLGSAYSSLGRVDEAIEQFRIALELRPEFASALVNMGVALTKKQQWNDAIGYFQSAIDLEPDIPKPYAGMGAALANLHRTDEAITAYETSLALDPRQPETLINLGVAYANQNRLDRAIKCFEDVLRMQPDHADAKRFLDMARRHAQPPSQPRP